MTAGPTPEPSQRRSAPCSTRRRAAARFDCTERWSGCCGTAGTRQGAIELESLWNELATQRTFSLFCAYTMSSLSTRATSRRSSRCATGTRDVVSLHDRSPHGRDPAVVGGPEHYERLFVAAPTVLREVRQFVRAVLHAWDDDEIGSTAEIVASELATNALQHAHSPFRISISRSPGVIRIAVRDTSFDPPEHVRDDARHDGGRGVRLVAALSRDWGTADEPDGKTVWAEVARAPRAHRSHGPALGVARGPALVGGEGLAIIVNPSAGSKGADDDDRRVLGRGLAGRRRDLRRSRTARCRVRSRGRRSGAR